MKNKFIFTLAASILFSQISLASPVNDTQTGIVSESGNCSVIHPTDAYFTMFGDGGGAGKVLFISATIQNLAFNKTVGIVHQNGQSATAQTSTNPVDLSIAYTGQSNGMDQVELQDMMVGSENTGVYQLSVSMNGNTSTCTFKVDRK